MKIHSLVSSALLLTLAACDSDPASAATLAGYWVQQTGTETPGMTLQFDSASDKMMVHTAPQPDGSHSHLSGTYTVAATSKTVTIYCALLGKGKGEVWQGKVEGESLTVAAGATKLTFGKGVDPHAPK